MDQFSNENEVKNEQPNEEVEKNIRIQARRDRMQRRLIADSRDVSADLVNQADIQESFRYRDTEGLIDSQLKKLLQLDLEARDLVTTIRVADDARFLQYADEMKRKLEEREERLEDEDRSILQQKDQFEKQWQLCLELKTAEDLNKNLNDLKARCSEMVGQKQVLILDLIRELNRLDGDLSKELKKQEKDIDLIQERMKKHWKILHTENRHCVIRVLESYYGERDQLLMKQKSRYAELLAQQQLKEVELLQRREKLSEELRSKLESLRTEDQEDLRSIKVKLDTDEEILLRNLQTARAMYMMNREKLENNFMIIKKREDENNLLRNNQKRKITKLQDQLSMLKGKLSSQAKSQSLESRALIEQISRLEMQFLELRQRQMENVDSENRVFADIWRMNAETAQQLHAYISSSFDLIHEKELLREIQTRQSLPPQIPSEFSNVPFRAAPVDIAGIQTSFRWDMMKKLLVAVGEEARFLVDSYFQTICSTLPEGDKDLVQVDAVLQALGIESVSELLDLCNFMMDQSQTSTAAGQKCSVPREDVIPLLRRYLDNQVSIEKTQQGSITSRSLSASWDKKALKEYWGSFNDLFNTDLLIHTQEGLEKYLKLLKSRSSLEEECENLRKQNLEFRTLLGHSAPK